MCSTKLTPNLASACVARVVFDMARLPPSRQWPFIADAATL
jgi:hypothetical protein